MSWRTGTALAFARTCYDHLAGELAVALAGALVDREVIAPLEPGVAADVLDPGHELPLKLTDQGGTR
ncbi:MAG: hypothetical protein M3446_01345 [Actinomycetota bacterium]|nr:hypothetical protein [Actinomycetota bacterium]